MKPNPRITLRDLDLGPEHRALLDAITRSGLRLVIIDCKFTGVVLDLSGYSEGPAPTLDGCLIDRGASVRLPVDPSFAIKLPRKGARQEVALS